jgi:2-oxoglutarate ferredoxin oxidoreductase subunit gamma
VDGDLVANAPTSRAVALPFTAAARDKLKRPMVANVIALGAVSALTGIVSLKALEKALLAHVPAGTEALNKKALALGVKLGREALGKVRPGQVWEFSAADM